MISASWAQKSTPVVAPVTMIRAGELIDGVSGSARRKVIITIRGNMITDVTDGGGSFLRTSPPALPSSIFHRPQYCPG